MTETTLFENSEGTNQNQADPLTDLVGDGKKFKTAADLAKGKLEADRFIEQLKDELKQTRDELAARTRMEELLDRIETANNQSAEYREEPSRQEYQTPDLDTLLERKLSEHEARKRAQDNIRTVRAKLEEVLGAENLDTKLKARVKELGLDERTVSDLAGRSPTAVLKLLEVASTTPSQIYYSPPASSVSITSSSVRPGEDRSYSYYQALRKSDPKAYASEKIQNQMHIDAQRLGEQFFDVEV